MKILVIDDEEMILALAGKILERSGYEVALAETGSGKISPPDEENPFLLKQIHHSLDYYKRNV